MIELIRDIRESGRAHILLSSHLLRDVEECCEEVLILKDGRIAVSCNIDEVRRANRKFLMLEIRGEERPFAGALEQLGCESAVTGEGRLKVVLPERLETGDLYSVASKMSVQIRSLQ